MADNLSISQRSYAMSKMRSQGNRSTELRMVELFRKNGIHGWRRNYKVHGHPDFVFLGKRVAVFIDGCFWHKCPKCFVRPKSNIEYWLPKIERNKKRDREVNVELRSRGWTVLRFWEHSLKRPKLVLKRLQQSL